MMQKKPITNIVKVQQNKSAGILFSTIPKEAADDLRLAPQTQIKFEKDPTDPKGRWYLSLFTPTNEETVYA